MYTVFLCLFFNLLTQPFFVLGNGKNGKRIDILLTDKVKDTGLVWFNPL